MNKKYIATDISRLCKKGYISNVIGSISDKLHATYPMCFDYRNTMGELIEWAKEEGVFAKALGLLDRANWSILF